MTISVSLPYLAALKVNPSAEKYLAAEVHAVYVMLVNSPNGDSVLVNTFLNSVGTGFSKTKLPALPPTNLTFLLVMVFSIWYVSIVNVVHNITIN